MPAQISLFVVYFVILLLFLPFAVLNFLINNTTFFPSVNSFIVSSESMKPQLYSGSLIYTVKKASYEIGDVVTFKDSLGRVTHRITDIINISGNTYYQTKGDANNSVDYELVANDKVYGTVQMQVPIIGSAILILKSLFS